MKQEFTKEQIMAFKNLFREARLAKGWTQTDVANMLLKNFGWVVSQTYVGSVELSPPNNIRIIEVLMLAKLYGIQPNKIAEVLGLYEPSRLEKVAQKISSQQQDAIAENIENGTYSNL